MKQLILKYTFVSLIFYTLLVKSLGDTECQQELTNIFAKQNIQYQCNQNFIVIENQTSLEFDFIIDSITVSTPIIINGIDSITIKQFRFVNSVANLDLKVEQFFIMKNIKTLKIEQILISLDQPQNTQLLKMENISFIDLNSINFQQAWTEVYNSQDIVRGEGDNININSINWNSFINFITFVGRISINNILVKNNNQSKQQQYFGIVLNSPDQITIDYISIERKIINVNPSSIYFFSVKIQFQPIEDQHINLVINKIDLNSYSQTSKLFSNQIEISIKSDYNIQREQSYNDSLIINNLILKENDESDSTSPFAFLLVRYISNVQINTIQLSNSLNYNSLIQIDFTKQIIINEINISSTRTMAHQIVSNKLLRADVSDFLSIDNIQCQNCDFQYYLIYLNSISKVSIHSFQVLGGFIEYPIFYAANSDQVEIINLQLKKVLKLSSSVITINNAQEILISNFQIDNFMLPLGVKSIENQISGIQNYIITISNSTSVTLINGNVNLENYQIGFLQTEMLKSLSITKYSIQNGYSFNNGGCFSLIAFQETQTILRIQDSNFYKCSSSFFGGAFFGGNIISIENVEFDSCSSNIGGALYVSSDSLKQEISKISYKNNIGNLCDKDLSFGIQRIQIDEIYEYNANLEDTQLYLKKISTSYPSKYFYNSMTYAVFFSFQIGDKWYNQFTHSNFFGNIFSYLVSKENYISTQIPNINNPYILLYYNEIPIQSNPFDQIINLNLFVQKLFSFTFFKQTKPICGIGMELIDIQNSDSFVCKYCEFSKALYYEFPDYRSNKSFPKCQTCDSSYFQQCYANYTHLRPSFWRKNYTISNDEIETCSIQPNNCIGGYEIGNQLCYEGHIGPQCLNCDVYGEFWNNTYAPYGQYQCNKCNSISQNTVKITVLLLVFILSIGIIIKSNFKNLKNRIYAMYLSKLGITYIGQSLQKKSLTSVYIKILIFNMFIYSLSNTFTQVDVIQSVKEFSFTLNNPLNSQEFSFQCFLIQILPKGFSIGFSNLIAFILVPISLIILIFLFLFISFYLKKINLKYLGYALFLSFLYLFMIVFYTSLLELCLKSFTCIRLVSNQTYSMIDLNLECDLDSEQVNSILTLSIPLFVILLIMIPLISFLQLFKNRKRLNTIKIMFTFGFLFKEYKQKFFYWEYIRLLLKILFICFSISFKQYSQVIGVTTTVCLVIYLISLQQLKPFNLKFLNTLEIYSITISIFILQSSIMFQDMNNQISTLLFSKISYVFFQIINIIFLVYMISLIIFSFYENQIKTLANKFRCLSFLERYFPQNHYRIHQNMKKFRLCTRILIQKEALISIEQSYQILSSNRLIQK